MKTLWPFIVITLGVFILIQCAINFMVVKVLRRLSKPENRRREQVERIRPGRKTPGVAGDGDNESVSCEKCYDSGRLSVIGNDGRAHEIDCRCGAARRRGDAKG
ncbi:MAG TPA: hypothetical protein VGR84_19100 [Candidatus Acidoferrales bacterium]|nr:hypothetical protein [Candidatus Acidoferrales bacterium]